MLQVTRSLLQLFTLLLCAIENTKQRGVTVCQENYVQKQPADRIWSRPQFLTPALSCTFQILNVLRLIIKFKNHPGIKMLQNHTFFKNGFINTAWWEKALFGESDNQSPKLASDTKLDKALNFLSHRLFDSFKIQTHYLWESFHIQAQLLLKRSNWELWV